MNALLLIGTMIGFLSVGVIAGFFMEFPTFNTVALCLLGGTCGGILLARLMLNSNKGD